MLRLKKAEGKVDLLVVAGEHSGDEHGGERVREYLRKNPGAKVYAVGGRHLEGAGAVLLEDSTRHSVVGLVEVLKNYGYFRKLFWGIVEWVRENRPKAVCFIDAPGMNLRLAKQLYREGLAKKAGGGVELMYYISPQIWAWKAKRRFEMEKYLDSLEVIFPFEVEFYKDTKLPVKFVGHPFLREGFVNPVQYDAEGGVLLLPGSRMTPVRRILPVMLEAFKLYAKEFKGVKGVIICASEELREEISRQVSKVCGEEIGERIELVGNEVMGVKARSVLMSSGTMSLKCALAGIPGAVVYRANPVTYWIGKMLVSIEYLGIANILLKEEVYREYLQGEARGEVLYEELKDIEVNRGMREAANIGYAGKLRQILFFKG